MILDFKYFDLYIDCILYYLFESHGFLILLLYLYFNGRLETFLEITNHSKLIKGPNRI